MTLNEQVGRRLDETADLLMEQGSNVYRVLAYRHAADSVRRLLEPVSEILRREGLEGLRRLPGIGDRLGIAVRDLVLTGRLPMLVRLRGETDPVELLRSVPGIGRVHAERLHHDLGIDSLEDLEAAAHDGRLAEIAGFGRKRLAAIVDSLATRLGRVRGGSALEPEPPVAELLEVDREYRELAAQEKLHKIAPRRFNPSGEAWLPILHTRRGERRYTALFSNTARAHRLGKTGEWVILYYDGQYGERQCTVTTGQQGRLKGLRIVRGRETECEQCYQAERERQLSRMSA